MNLSELLNDPTTQRGLLELGLRLMSTPGKFSQALGQSGLGAMQGMQQYQNQQFQSKLQQAQLSDLERKKKQQEAEDQFRAGLVSPQMQASQAALAGGGGPTVANAQRMPAVDPNMSMLYGATKAGLMSPLDYVRAQQKDTTPIKLGAGEVLLKPGTYQPLASNPKEDATDPFVRLLKASGIDPASPEGRKLIGDRLAKETSHPPAASIKIDNKLGEGLAKEVGPMIADSASRAQGAQQQISNADTIIRAVDTNRLYAGPGANIRLKGAQIGQMLGIGGKDAAESVANTRSVIQGLARATVAARGALKGQGQVSDFEGKLLAKAESGDIEDMTPAEIRYIASKNKEYGTKLIEQHAQLIKKAKGNQSTAGIADFFDVPQTQGQVLDWGSLPNGR